MSNINLVSGDILELEADALVCPAHKHLIPGRGLSAQVFALGGEYLLAACSQQEDCAIGEARLTRAFNLRSSFIIHTVTPQWTGGDQWGGSTLEQLRHCYENSLALAREHDLRTLLFPALGTGHNRTPHMIAAHLGLQVLLQQGQDFAEITICLSDRATLREWQEALDRIGNARARQALAS